MTIGERIKRLRKENDMTQENLADYLCVSYQAVSKWECGLSCPDISLIVPLARLLKVSTDELLGAVTEEADARYLELEELYAATYKTGDLSERIKISETAMKEYPGDMVWLNSYAWDVWCGAMEKDQAAFEADREKAIKLFDTVIENADQDKIKAHAITGIVQCLCGKGCKAEARRYVDLFPASDVSLNEKDYLLGMCLDGEEQITHKQHCLEGYLQELMDKLMWDCVAEERYTCQAAEGVLKAMIPDGNYFSYHFEMSYIQFRKAELAIKADEENDAIKCLQKSVYHAKEYDLVSRVAPREYTFSAPLFDRLTYDSREWCHTGTTTLLEDIQEMCKRKSFDPIRSRKDFQALMET